MTAFAIVVLGLGAVSGALGVALEVSRGWFARPTSRGKGRRR